MTDWSQFTPVEDEEPQSGIDWSAFEPITEEPKRELPAGVKASQAEAGRGAADFAATDPRRVDIERPKTRLVGSTRGGFRAEEVKPRAGSGPSVLDRVPVEEQQRIADRNPLTDAQLVELQKSPELREREAAAIRERNRQQSVSMTEAPERGAVQRVLDKTIRKPEQRGLGDLLLEGAGDAARGTVRAAQGVAGSAWSGIQAGAEAVGAGDSGLAKLAGEAGRAARENRTQWGNPTDPDSITQQVFESTFTSVPALALLGAGNPALVVMGAQAAANDYGESRDAGKTHDEAVGRAAYMGVAEMLGERVGLPELGKLFRQAATKATVKELAGTLERLIVKEQVGEQATLALQDAYEKWGAQGRRPDMTLADYIDDMAATAKVTLGQSLLMGGAAGVARRVAPKPSREEEFANAFAADTAERDYSPEGIDRAATTLLSPNSAAWSGQVSPELTAKPVPRAPRVEEQPDEILAPEELAAQAQAAAAQRAATQPVEPAPLPQPAGQDEVRLPERRVGDIGVATIPQGSQVAAAEQLLKSHAQETASAGVPDVPVPGAGERRAGGGAVDQGGVGAAGRVVDQPGARPAGAGAPVASPGQAGLLRAGADGQQAALTPAAPPTAQAATISVDEQAQQPAAGRAVDPQATAVPPTVGAGRDGRAVGPTGNRRTDRQAILDQHVATIQRRVNDWRIQAGRAERAGQPDLAARIRQHAEAEQQRIDALESAVDHEAVAAFEPVADRLEKKFGWDVVPYVDQSEGAGDGFTDGDTVFVNLANPQKSVAFSAVHELQHVIRRQGERGSARAQNATKLLDQVWGMIDEGHKRAYAEKYLLPDMTYEQVLADPKLSAHLRDEVMSDFMAGRADDVSFWRDLARKQPETFGDFVREWIATLKDLIAALRGRGERSIKDIDPAIKNLERAKAVAERVFAEWVALNPKLAGAKPAANDDQARTQTSDGVTSGERSESARRRIPVDEFDDSGKDADSYVPATPFVSESGLAMDELEADEVIVADDVFADDGELSEAEMEVVQAELSEALGLVQLPDQAPIVKYPSPEDAALKKVGIMAEDAFEPIEYAEVAMRGEDGEVFGSKQEARLQIGGDPWSAWGFSVTSNDGGVTFASHTPLQKLAGLGTGQPWGLSKVSEQVAKDWNRRVAASVDLMRRKFDLAKAVPPAARKRVVEVWRELATRPGAFEFGPRAKPDRAAPNVEKLQQIADALLTGTRYTATAGSGGASNWWALAITDTKTGVTGTGSIEFVGGADRRFVMHATDFDRGSGLGKPFYQVALAFSHEMGIPTNADPSGLLGVNNYRRTDQSFSAALRAGFSSAVNPGIGQRVYGWDKKAKTDDQHDANLLRLALAQARNVAEFIPSVRELSYNLASDTFVWRKGRDAGQPADDWLKRQLANQDVRQVSISRSTVARAAITFEAVERQVDVPDELEVAAPVLYSRRGGFFPDEGDSDGGYAALAQAKKDGYNRLANRQLKVPVRLADSGETVELTVDAAKAMTRLDERQSLFEELVECLSR